MMASTKLNLHDLTSTLGRGARAGEAAADPSLAGRGDLDARASADLGVGEAATRSRMSVSSSSPIFAPELELMTPVATSCSVTATNKRTRVTKRASARCTLTRTGVSGQQRR